MPVKNYDKILLKAVEQILQNVPPDHNGLVNTDEVYKLLDLNVQKKIRKRTIYMYLVKKKLACPEDEHYSFQSPHVSKHTIATGFSYNPPSPHESLSSPSSTSSHSGLSTTTAASLAANDFDTKENCSDEQNLKGFALANAQNKIEDRVKRVIKRKQVFDPSDFEKPAKKILEETIENLCKVCSEEINTLPPETKPLNTIVCTGCSKSVAHGNCVRCEEQPWRCDSCKVCFVCHSKRINKSEALVVCKLCKVALHPRCSAIPINKTNDWFCTNCSTMMNSFGADRAQGKDEKSVTEAAKPKSRRPSKVAVKSDVDVPDCSDWTPQQVHAYVQMFVPSQDAQVVMDQEIDGRSLQLLQRTDVIKNFKLKLGSALKLYAIIKRLQERSWDFTLCWN